jgi:hypothetical protein
MLTSVVVRAQPGVSQQTLADRIGAVLPGNLESITGATLIAQAESQVDSDFFSYFQIFLGGFARKRGGAARARSGCASPRTCTTCSPTTSP